MRVAADEVPKTAASLFVAIAEASGVAGATIKMRGMRTRPPPPSSLRFTTKPRPPTPMRLPSWKAVSPGHSNSALQVFAVSLPLVSLA